MSTTSCAGMTHRNACAQGLASLYLWAAKNRLSFLLGPEADQLVIFFRTRLSGYCPPVRRGLTSPPASSDRPAYQGSDASRIRHR